MRIFNRSINKYGLRYINYIGDGDSSAYKEVSESKPYGDQPVSKLECVGPWPSINTGLDNVHVILCIYEQEVCYVINILYIVTVY